MKNYLDKGMWSVRINNNKVFIESDDFTHDVSLLVQGDFEDLEAKERYAKTLAEWMNSHLSH